MEFRKIIESLTKNIKRLSMLCNFFYSLAMFHFFEIFNSLSKVFAQFSMCMGFEWSFEQLSKVFQRFKIFSTGVLFSASLRSEISQRESQTRQDVEDLKQEVKDIRWNEERAVLRTSLLKSKFILKFAKSVQEQMYRWEQI